MSDTPTPTPRPKVYIATPSHDHKFHACFAFALLKLQAANLFPLHLSKVGGAGVARARNNQAHDFLVNTDATYFFCVDADIDFTPPQFARIVNHGLKNVAGLYPLKQRELQWCVNAIAGEEPDPRTGVQRVAKTGTGFKCIHRSVFEEQIRAHPEIAYHEDLGDARGVVRWDFFSMGVVGPGSPESRLAEVRRLLDAPLDGPELRAALRQVLTRAHPPGRYITEDWYFDHRCAGLAIPVHVDTTFHLLHEGLITYPLEPVVMDELPAAPLWPAAYLAAGIAPDHCADVLAGAYDVPLDFAQPPRILDLGANIGAFARWAARRWPGARIHCYEPSPANFALLQQTAQQASDRIACLPYAVLDRACVMPLRTGANNCGEHSFYDLGEQLATTVDVSVIAASVLPAADILKIDTEGAELRILASLAAAGRLPEFHAIMLEYHFELDRGLIKELLLAHGFQLYAEKPRCPDRGELKFIRAIDSAATP